jgi:hypothetical protein
MPIDTHGTGDWMDEVMSIMTPEEASAERARELEAIANYVPPAPASNTRVAAGGFGANQLGVARLRVIVRESGAAQLRVTECDPRRNRVAGGVTRS